MLRNPFDQFEDPVEKKLFKFRVYLAAAILGGVLLCSGLILGGLALQNMTEAPARSTQEASFESVKPLKELCAGGSGSAAAAGYAPGSEPQRLVVFRSNIAGSTDLSTFYIRTEDYPEAWRAAVVEQAALVACVSTGTTIVEECAYTLSDGATATLQREQMSAQINVYAARTGELVGRGELPGPEPRACGDTEQFVEGSLTATITGEAVPPEAIAEWLRKFVVQ